MSLLQIRVRIRNGKICSDFFSEDRDSFFHNSIYLGEDDQKEKQFYKKEFQWENDHSSLSREQNRGNFQYKFSNQNPIVIDYEIPINDIFIICQHSPDKSGSCHRELINLSNIQTQGLKFNIS